MKSERLAWVAAALAAALLGTADPAAAVGRTEVLVVGDEVAEITVSHLRQELPAARVIARTAPGSDSKQVLGLLKRSFDPSFSVVVFDAGANNDDHNPLNLNLHLETAAGTIGDRCLIAPTVRGPLGQDDDEAKNRALFEFAESRPATTQVPEWWGATEMRPGLLDAAGLPTAAGARFRAHLIARAIDECLARKAGSGQAAVRPKPVRLEPLDLTGPLIAAIQADAAVEVMRVFVLTALARTILPS